MIIGSNEETTALCDLPIDYIADISLVPDKDSIELDITKGINRLTDITYSHIYKFQYHLIRNHQKFNDLTPYNSREKLKNEAKNIFGKVSPTRN